MYDENEQNVLAMAALYSKMSAKEIRNNIQLNVSMFSHTLFALSAMGRADSCHCWILNSIIFAEI